MKSDRIGVSLRVLMVCVVFGLLSCASDLAFAEVPLRRAQFSSSEFSASLIDQNSEYREELRHTPLNQTLKDWRFIEKAHGCSYYDVSVPVVDPRDLSTRQYIVRLAAPIGVQYQPAMLIVPTIRGSATLENKIQKEMCVRGMYSVIANVNEMGSPEQVPDWQFHDRSQRHAILALRTIIDFLQQIPQVNPEKIGVWGSSLGGIVTGILVSVEPRLKAVVIAAGGTDLAEILVNSDQEQVVELRKMRTPYLADDSDETYMSELRKWIRYDASILLSGAVPDAERVPASKIYMMVNLTDSKVPTKNQLRLWEVLGRPERIDLEDRHALSLIRFTWFHINSTLDKVEGYLHSSSVQGLVPRPGQVSAR